MDYERSPHPGTEVVPPQPPLTQLADTLRPFFEHGAQVTFDEHGVIETVTYVVSAGVEKKVSDLLFELGIEPYIERGNTVVEYRIDNKRQIGQLQNLGLAPETLTLPPVGVTEETTAVEVATNTPAEETDTNLVDAAAVIPNQPTGFEFPLKRQPTFRTRMTPTRTPTKVITETDADVPAIDTDLRKIIETFKTGHSAENIPEEIGSKNPYRSTEKFTRKYRWQQGELYTVSGEHISQETFMNLLDEAKTSDTALATVMQMNEGLLHFVYQNITRKYNPNHIVDADDLLQAGRIGLLQAVKKREPDLLYGYQSYFIKYMEGHMRNALRRRGVLTFPSTENGIPSKFYTALRAIEAEEGPQFILTTKLETQIAQRADIKLSDVKLFGQAVFGRLALTYDEENEAVYAEEQIGQGDRSHVTDESFDAYALTELRDTIGELLNTINASEDLVIRMRFGVVDNSNRWRSKDILSLFTDASVRRRIDEKLTALTSKRLLSLGVFKSLTKAERFFLTLTGHLPMGAIADLQGPVDAHTAVCTLEEVSGVFGVTKDRIRQVEAKALRHLRHPTRTRKIRSFLDV